MNHALVLLAWSDLRRRAVAIAALMLIVGLAGTFVLTAAIGARRADTAVERFFEATRTWDGALIVDLPEAEALRAAVAEHPDVEAVTIGATVLLIPNLDLAGVVAGLADGWLETVYRPVVVEGRLPRPDAIDEVSINEAAATRHGVEPGDRLVLMDFFGLGLAQPVTVVGVHRGPLDLALPDLAPELVASTAFGKRYAEPFWAVFASTPYAEVFRPRVVARFRAGANDPLATLRAIAGDHPEGAPQVEDPADLFSPIGAGIDVQTSAYWLLTAVAGASAAVILGLAVVRLVSLSRHDDDSLLAIGLDGRRRTILHLVPAVVVALGGGVLSVIGAMLASPLVPTGGAGRVDPATGLWFDGPVLLFGCAGVLAVVLAAGTVGASPRISQAARHRARPMPSPGLPLWGLVGRYLAFGGSTRGRSAAAASAVGIALVATVVVYAASLDRTINDPARFGSDFDLIAFDEGFADAGDPPTFAVDPADPMITAVAQGSTALLFHDDTRVYGLVIDAIRGSVVPTVTDGRAPATDDEIAVAPLTMDELDLEVGDPVVLAGVGDKTFRVVGRVLLPILGLTNYGEGFWLTRAGAASIGAEITEPRLFLRVDDATAFDQLDSVISVPAPDAVLNLDDVGGIAALLALFGGALSAVVVAFSLFAMVAGRRRDLAVGRALGLNANQLRASVAFAGVALVGPGALAGLVAGIVAGRSYWARVARGVPVVEDAVVPYGTLLTVLLVGLVGALLMTWWPARRSTRLQPSAVLRQE